MNSATTPCTLPDTLPISVGVISFDDDFPFDSADELATHCANVAKLMSLIPDNDKRDPEFSSDCFEGRVYQSIHITTDDEDALKLAHELGFINEYHTAIHAVIDYYCDEETCRDCLDEQVDHALEHDYEIVVNEDGELDLKLGPCKAAPAESKQLELAAV